MRIPVIRGVIERRILANYRLDPDVARRVIPAPFRPKLVEGHAIAGICLIRLSGVRPRGLPAAIGIHSENCAHRFAVEWDTPEGVREGVYIPRRDTSSALNALVGGRVFPGVHSHAKFDVHETPESLSVALESDDGVTRIAVEGDIVPELSPGSVFGTLARASRFFEGGSLGYSVTREPGVYDGLELRTQRWSVEALAIRNVRSSFFDDTGRFPAGSIAFDCALVMRDIEHEWHGRDVIRAAE